MSAPPAEPISSANPAPEFLPGVPVEHVLQRLSQAGGKEVESGKFASAESSAALAVNTFGWFISQPKRLPPLPGLDSAGTPELVDVEFCARFPWPGGRHPWLDAVVQSKSTLIGVESKRYEPFRDKKTVSLSPAYDRPVWGANMQRFESMRDWLRSDELAFAYLDAAQLVKHAFGLVTTARRRNVAPVLYYLFAEPETRNGQLLDKAALKQHRMEAERFREQVSGDEVAFQFASYRDWLSTWGDDEPDLVAHRSAVFERFAP